MNPATMRNLRIGFIIARDDDPPEKMNPRQYRAWLESLSDDDLLEWSALIRKTKKQKS